jgi:hypothetical protein
MRRHLTVLLVAGTMSLIAAPALAHTGLEKGVPGPGETVAAGLTRMVLTFDRLEPAGRPVVSVHDAGGRVVSTAVRQVGVKVIEVDVVPLQPGIHKIDYTIVAGDSHPSTGGYYFTVAAAQDLSAAQARSALWVGAALVATVAAGGLWLYRRDRAGARAAAE